jgi:hypothetical protein
MKTDCCKTCRLQVSLNTSLLPCGAGQCPVWQPPVKSNQVTQLQFIYTPPLTSQVQIQSIVPSGNISKNPAPVATTAAGIYVINNLSQNNGDNVAVSCSATVSQTYSSTTTNSVSKEVSSSHQQFIRIQSNRVKCI